MDLDRFISFEVMLFPEILSGMMGTMFIKTINGRRHRGVNPLDLYERLNLTIRNAQEVVTVEELKELLEVHSSPRAYWGFECSGQQVR
ncbi:MAG: hypothetical protein QXR65_01455 [Candidatus Bathyarchaeia archaeon]